MSETVTHTGGETSVYNPITGEAPGIKEILERRTAGEREPEAHETVEQADDAETAAAELASWRNRATEAERQATEARERADRAERERAQIARGAEDTGFTAITTALTATEQSIAALRSDMRTAGESGDFARVADISAQLGELGAEARELRRGKEQYERQRTERVAAPVQQQVQAEFATERAILARIGATSRTAFLSSRTPDTRAFLERHPEFFTDDSKFNLISGADTLARGRGIKMDTPEYFSFLEKEANLTSAPANQRRERTAAPGAAPSRESVAPNGRRASGDVYVTAEQKAAAAWMEIDPADYARDEKELRARGELPYRRR